MKKSAFARTIKTLYKNLCYRTDVIVLGHQKDGVLVIHFSIIDISPSR